MPKFDINISKNVTNLVSEPLHNLLDKPTAALGEGIASIFDLVFVIPKHLSQVYKQKAEAYKQEIENKAEKIPPENLTEPDFHTVYVALENSKSCITNEALRKMFVNLIGSSMNSLTSNSVHPSFASIINQMSVLDAKLLMTFEFRESYPVLELREKVDHDGYQIFMTNLFSYITLNEGDCIDLNVAQIQSSISNLDRLGLIKVDYLQHLTGAQSYSDLEESANKLYEGHSIAVKNRLMQKGVAFLTPFGKDFINVCLSD